MLPHRLGDTASLALVATGVAISAQDKYALKVPGGLAFSEFKGYEGWQLISVSHNGPLLAAIFGNPTMIEAYKAGIPGNGKPFPDGSKMAKVHWNPKKNDAQPGQPLQPATQHDVDFMVKDSKRFADSGRWGWAAFEYDVASASFKPADSTANPPQGNDAKCGFACHQIVKKGTTFSRSTPQDEAASGCPVAEGSVADIAPTAVSAFADTAPRSASRVDKQVARNGMPRAQPRSTL